MNIPHNEDFIDSALNIELLMLQIDENYILVDLRLSYYST